MVSGTAVVFLGGLGLVLASAGECDQGDCAHDGILMNPKELFMGGPSVRKGYESVEKTVRSFSSLDEASPYLNNVERLAFNGPQKNATSTVVTTEHSGISFEGNQQTNASLGDSFPVYKSCVDTCRLEYCEKEGYYFKQSIGGHSWPGLLQWRCSDDCKYRCMWSIVDNFERKGWPPPQFHGKWPFVRCLGLQEPASVVFSIMNLAVHIIMFRKFRSEVRPSSPMYKVWFLYAGVCINCWIWSAIFHSRDLPLTELMDYLSAFGMVFYSLYGMIMRVMIGAPRLLPVLFTLVCISFFINHAGYLVLDQFDYNYNMSANIAVGILSAGVSAIWSLASWRQLNHSKYLATVVVLGLLTTLLEVSDFPPYFWTFDAHALWHLSTIPIPYFFWRFVIEDCKHLRKTLKER